MDMQNNSRAAELRLYLKSRMSSMPYRGLIRDIYVSEDKDGKRSSRTVTLSLSGRSISALREQIPIPNGGESRRTSTEK